MDLGIKGKVALVAGASQGLGYAIAMGLAQEGVNVAICSRDADRINKAAERIRKETGVSVLASALNITHRDEIEKWVKMVEKEWNAIHICVTNTGGPPSSTFMETQDEQWHNAVSLTLMSAVRLSQAVVPIMQKKNGVVLFIFVLLR
jgi:3-oxoacyl-[acyl-carrier protein] reductase